MTTRNTLLIVDDEPANLDQLCSLLGRHRCLVATSGEQALAMLEGGSRPDLVLLDIVMQGIDGYETLTRLRRQPGTGSLPVIFISALDQAEDELRGLKLGAVDYIAKPFHPDVVNARVETHLELQRMRAQLAERNGRLEEMIQLREDVERITQHDLKSPLGAIISNCELMRMQGSTPKLEASIRRIEVSGHRILEMVNRSLDLYKMETGRYQVAWETVPLAETLRASVETLDSLFKAFRARPATTFGEGGETLAIRSEKTLLFSLFENLIRNAVEATELGGVIDIDLSRRDSEARIAIHNSGLVPEEIRERFFEKYATAGKSAGTGLGTYSARLICETLGGRISMRSQQGEGTTLELAFPLPEAG